MTPAEPGSSAPVLTEGLLRRALIAAGSPLYPRQDLIDAAALAEGETARMLEEIVELRRGFADPNRDLPGFSVDRAVVELRALVADVGEGAALPAEPSALVPAPALERTVVRPMSSIQAADITRLSEALRSGKAVEEVLRDLSRQLEAPGLRAKDQVGLPIERLAEIAAGAILRHWFAHAGALAQAPFGSARLFAAAARLDPAGLGGYFFNVANLLRSPRDLFGLIQLATSERSAGTFERWIVPMSAWLPRHTRLELIDELADRGLVTGLWGFLAATVRVLPDEPDERECLWRLRDAGLDLGLSDLALRAQQHIALSDPSNRIEWAILGEIHGTFGETEAAEAMFARALALAPEDAATLTRLAALKAGAFDDYAVRGGFGTAKSRQRLRVARFRDAA